MRQVLPAVSIVAGLALALPGCTTVRQVMALRQVEFAIDRVASVSLAGVTLDQLRSFDDLSVRDGGRLAVAIARGEMPLGFTLHVRGENPSQNQVTARMLRLTWTLALNGRETVSGVVDTTYTFPPGEPQDVALPVRLDLYQFFRASARDAYELALGLLEVGGRPTEVSLRATPVIDTPLGAIRYPTAITIVRRTIGGP